MNAGDDWHFGIPHIKAHKIDYLNGYSGSGSSIFGYLAGVDQLLIRIFFLEMHYNDADFYFEMII